MKRRVVQFRIVMSASYDTQRKKIKSFPTRFDIKSWVTCGTKIRPGKVGNWRIFESNWLNIKSQIDSTLRVKLTQHWESNWLNIESQIGLTLRVKLAQHWEPNWLNIESQIGSTLRVKLTQHWESNWLNTVSQIDSTLWVKLTQHWDSNWLKYSPVTHFARLNYNSATDLTFKVKMTEFFLSVHWEKKIESFWSKKLGQILVPPVTQLFRSKWLNFFSLCTER